MGTTDRLTGWGGEMVEAPSLSEVCAARDRIKGVVSSTPLVKLKSDSNSEDVLLKPEMFQPTGSFKLRGVYSWASSLTDAGRHRGLSTASAGNTALALGYVAGLYGVTAHSVLSDRVSDAKLKAIRRYGVEPRTMSLNEVLEYMLEERWREETYSYLNPWGDPMMIAGHGTIALEIIEEVSRIDTIYVPVGGGGLIAGVASVIKHSNPSVHVVGVQAESCPALHSAFEAGRSVWVNARPTLCDGASSPLIVDEMFPLLSQVVDEVQLVSEESATSCIRMLALDNGLFVEGSGAISVAAALSTPRSIRGKAVCILSGGNIGQQQMQSILGRYI